MNMKLSPVTFNIQFLAIDINVFRFFSIEGVIVTVLSVGNCYGNTLNGLVEKNVMEIGSIYERPYCFLFHCATLIY